MNYIVPLLSMLLLIFLSWKEYSRNNRAHLTGRLLCSFFAVTSLACFYYNLTYTKTIQRQTADTGILLTEGFNTDSIVQFQKSLRHPAPVFSFDPAIAANKNYGANLLELPNNTAPFQWHVFGHGLGEEELRAIKNSRIVFHKPELKNNFESVGWKQKLRNGEALRIQGKYYNAENEPIKIILQGFGTDLDSVVINGGNSASFQLTTIPKNAGRAVFALMVKKEGTKGAKGSEKLQEQKIPFEVATADPLKILLLAASPDFENKFLRDWLHENHHSIAIRTTISRNKYNKQYFNIEDMGLEALSVSMLNRFHLVIADATELASINSSQLNNIRNAVQNHGIGLIVKADSITAKNLFFNEAFHISRSTSSLQQQVALHLQDSSADLPTMIMERPLYINAAPRTRSILTDKQDRHYISTAISGIGKIVYTTIPNTYKWVLSGDTTAYRVLWSKLLTEAAKKNTVSTKHQIIPAIPVVHEPATVLVNSSDSLPPDEQVNTAILAMQQDVERPFQWEGSYWPTEQGWQHSINGQNKIYHWYAYDPDDWKDIQSTRKINRMLGHLSDQPDTNQLRQSVEQTVKIPIPKIYFFVIFIFCCAYLWIEEKFYNTKL
jgi:hypothetical protein